jgi:1-deoxy-D-xylulose-5-phosphate reductoisomerase
MNAANEIAVAAFLAEEIPFLAIPEVIERAMDSIDHGVVGHFSQLADIDVEARVKAREAIAETVLD